MTDTVASEQPSPSSPQSGLPGGNAPEPIAPTLDYGRGDNSSRSAREGFARFTGGFWDRVHGVAEFVGMISAMGFCRRLGLGVGLAAVLGGLGHLIATFTAYFPSEVHGWGWMAFGGFVLGLSLPSGAKRN